MRGKFPVMFKNPLFIGVVVILIITSLAAGFYLSRKIYANYLLKKVTMARIVTSEGEIVFKLRLDSPRATENFINLARSGYYNETRVYRVVPNLLIEMGDPNSRNLDRKFEWGKGGPEYDFPNETDSDDQMVRGVVAMVNSGENTNGSKFFILSSDALWLNSENTIFGDVELGMEIVDNISSGDVGITGIPLKDIKILEVVVY